MFNIAVVNELGVYSAWENIAQPNYTPKSDRRTFEYFLASPLGLAFACSFESIMGVRLSKTMTIEFDIYTALHTYTNRCIISINVLRMHFPTKFTDCFAWCACVFVRVLS